MLTLWVLLINQPRIALWWLIAVTFCMGTTSVLKIYFFACSPLYDLHSPNGHTGLSMLVYGTLTLAIASATTGWRRIGVFVVGATFIIGIAISRLVVSAHSIPEVRVADRWNRSLRLCTRLSP